MELLTRRAVPLALTALLAGTLLGPVGGCGGSPADAGTSDATTAADGHFRPDRTEYTLRAERLGLEAEIPWLYENPTGDTLYVVNCNRIAPPVLEKRVDDEWVTAWRASVPRCLSSPIVIEPGASHHDTLRVFGGYAANNVHPKFDVQAVGGTYRMVWGEVLRSFDPNARPFGEALPRDLRTSSTFLLREPA